MRESLGGPWYARIAGWLLVFPGVVLLVFGQDSELRSASVLLVLASAALQHLAGGIVFFVVPRLCNLRWPLIPIPVAIVGWVASGAARGVVGGLFVNAAIGASPDFLYRIGTWVVVVAATQPLITYLLAQIDHRRVMLGQLDAALTSLQAARADSRQSTARTRLRLVATVRDTIDPVMWEVRASLRSLSTETDPVLLDTIGHRLEVITEDIERILTDPHTSDEPEGAEGAPRAQLITAVDFPPSHYVLSVVLPPVMVIALLAPEGWRRAGPHGIEEILVAAFVSSVVLAIVFAGQAALAAVSERLRLLALRLGFLFAGLAASAAALVTCLAIGGPEDQTIVYLLPVAVAVSAAMVMGALGIAAANRNLAEALDVVNEDDQRIRRSTAARNLRASTQVATLLHGPVIGRLSACVMAINFGAADLAQSNKPVASQIATRILGHLEAAAIDLELLSHG